MDFNNTINACLGVLIKNDKILITSRPEGKVMAGYWEFPGGKLEHGETYSDALLRELHEELGVLVTANNMQYLGEIKHQYTHGLAILSVVLIKNWSHEITPLEGQKIHWHKLGTSVLVSPLLPTTDEVINMIKKGL